MIFDAPHAHRPTYRSPRGIVLLNGEAIPFTKFYVVQPDFSKAATFDIETAWQPLDTQTNKWLTQDPNNTSQLFSNDKVTVEIWAGYPKDPDNYSTGDLNRIMYGQLDTDDFSGDINGEILKLSGRNMVGPMIDEQTTYLKWSNMTGSQIAGTLADKYGLGKQITPTSNFAGTYFQQESANLTSTISEWDLLVQVAAFDQYIVHVEDDVLYYGPTSYVSSMIDISNLTNLQYTWGYDIKRFDLTRSPNAVQDIEVHVISYNTEFKAKVEGIAKSHAPKVSAANPGTYIEKLIWPGLTQEQAQAKADQLLHQLSQKQIQGNIEVDGESYIKIYEKIKLNGLGKGLDGDYYVTKVEHTYTMPQDGSTASDGADTTDGYITNIYLSSQLLLDTNTVNNPLGIGSPVDGTPPVTDTTQVSSSGKIYPPPGWHGMSQDTQKNVRAWLANAIEIAHVDVNAWMPGLMWLVEAESTGDPSQKNQQGVKYYSNSSTLYYAEGLLQVMPPTFQQYAVPGHGDIWNPIDNAVASIRYIIATYTTVDNIPNIGTSSYIGY